MKTIQSSALGLLAETGELLELDSSSIDILGMAGTKAFSRQHRRVSGTI